MEKKYVLAMYDVRGKQEFIFRTNKIQEIIGGSWIIRDIFDDYLYPAAEFESESGKGIYSYKKIKDNSSFTKTGFEQHLAEGFVGEVVYDGGGNFWLLFKDKETFQKVTYRFTRDLMKAIGTLRVLATCIEVSENLDDYEGDNRRMHSLHRKHEAMESIISPWACLPIAQVDRKTSQPLVDYTERLNDYKKDTAYGISVAETIKAKDNNNKLSKESFAKLLKFHDECARIKNSDESKLTEIERDFYQKNEIILDNITEEKGVDSKLAVIYIDGNNMGAQVEKATNKVSGYEATIAKLRDFSEAIQKIYVENGIKAALSNIKDNNESPFRIVVSAGDEINFIVKASHAFHCAKNYLDYLKKKDQASACAGISVFHSHAPYSDAYRIAEELCESGKKKMKEAGLDNAAFIDFHIGQGATGVSLEQIRELENADGVSRPWLMWKKSEQTKSNVQITDFETIERVISLFNELGRSNVKGLASAAKQGKLELTMELKRIRAHQSEKEQEKLKGEWEWILGDPSLRNAIYDIVIGYDLWFKDYILSTDTQEAEL